jgi:hypothetical protein
MQMVWLPIVIRARKGAKLLRRERAAANLPPSRGGLVDRYSAATSLTIFVPDEPLVLER